MVCLTPLSKVVQSHQGDRLHYSCFIRTRLGFCKYFAQGHSLEKTQRIQSGSNPGHFTTEPRRTPNNRLNLDRVKTVNDEKKKVWEVRMLT